MTANRRALLFFVVGVLTAFALQWVKAETFDGNWAGLLAVGRESELARFITSDLGDVPLWDGIGHDGQASYAIARDPLGTELWTLIDNPGYRYRRILYPLVAGLGGVLSPRATLTGLIVVAAVGIGLGAAGISMLASTWKLPGWLPAVLLINPGMWLSVQLLTSDSLALGLTLYGIGLVATAYLKPGAASLSVSALAKELYFLSALAVAFCPAKGPTTSQRTRLLMVASIPLAAWALYTFIRFGGDAHGNLGLPFQGLVSAFRGAWAELPGHELFYLGVALVGWLSAAIGTLVAKETLLRVLCGLYSALGAVASHLVWNLGNNAVRTLLPAAIFGLIGLISAVSRRSRQAAAQTISRRYLPV